MKYFDSDRGALQKEAFEATVADWPEVSATTMFGCPSYQAGGTLFAVLVTGGVALTRLPPDARETLEASFEARPFKAGSRTVRTWIEVPFGNRSGLERPLPYVEASYQQALKEAKA